MSHLKDNQIINYATNCIIGHLVLKNLSTINNGFEFTSGLLSKDIDSSLNLYLTTQLNNNISLISSSSLWKDTNISKTSFTQKDIIYKLQCSFILIKCYLHLATIWVISHQKLPLLQSINESIKDNGFFTFKDLTHHINTQLDTSFSETFNTFITDCANNIDFIIKDNINLNNIPQILNILEEEYINSWVTILTFSKTFETLRINLLGKNGVITLITKNLNNIPALNRKTLGLFFNTLKYKLNTIITKSKNLYIEEELNFTLLQESIDVTLPVYNLKQGKIHPLTQVLEEVVAIFNKLGFVTVEGPEIEDEATNFTALNFSEFHPAKDSHDTFYFTSTQNKILLRTHTSTVQIRTLQNSSPPLKIIAPGKVYRSDDDATHTPMFHQIEGLYVDKNVSIAQLKYILITFCEKFFGISNIPLRFRPSYFPFTSPSLEIDIGCSINKKQVTISKGKDWLEILGCGMIHPNVLRNCNINPKEYNGFAFGMGVERLAMLKYGFPDLRDFFNNNHLWLKAYNFNVIKSLYTRET